MKDPEFIELKNRFLMALGIALIFTIPMLFFVINRFSVKPSKLLESIEKKENLLILVTKENCSSCQKNIEILNEKDIPYYELNKDTEENTYQEMLQKISMSNDDVTPPTIIYLEEGKLTSSLVNPSKKELLTYLEYHQFTSTK